MLPNGFWFLNSTYSIQIKIVNSILNLYPIFLHFTVLPPPCVEFCNCVFQKMFPLSSCSSIQYNSQTFNAEAKGSEGTDAVPRNLGIPKAFSKILFARLSHWNGTYNVKLQRWFLILFFLKLNPWHKACFLCLC